MPLLTVEDLIKGDEKEVETLVGIASGISETYDRYQDEDKGDTHTRAPGLHASEISGCMRRSVYSLMGEKRIERTALHWKRRFKTGHAIHDMFQKDFHRMAKRGDLLVTFQDEVKLKPCVEQPLSAKWDVQSSADGIFTLWEEKNGEKKPFIRVLLEIKTASPTDFEKLNGPKEEHIDQATMYMACLDVPLVWFLYYNKGNQNFTPSTNPSFFRRFEPKRWATLEDRFEKIHTHAALKTLPDRQESVLCEFCAFSHVCEPNILKVHRSGHKPPPAHWGKR
jgi:hypothetical protein